MSEAEEQYRACWGRKTAKQIAREIDSFRRYFQKHNDCFFHESPKDQLTDGLRLCILKEILESKNAVN